MAWYNAILGGGSPLTNGLQSSSASGTYPTGIMQSSSTSSSIAAGQILAVNGAAGQTYWNTTTAQSSTNISHQGAVYTVKNYTDAIGWELTHHHLPVGMSSDDPKIAMLKLIPAGEVLKDVGIRTSDVDFYVMREPSA